MVEQEKMEQDQPIRFDFGAELQKRILSMMLYNVDFLIQAEKFIQPYYFESESLRWLAETILVHFKTYRCHITQEIIAEHLKKVRPDRMLEYTTVARDCFKLRINEDRYLKDALKEFVQRNVFVRGWDTISKAYNTGDSTEAFKKFSETQSKIKEIDFSPPDRSNFFRSYNERKAKREAEKENKNQFVFPTGIHDLDEHLGGGLKRTEVGLLFGDAKIGKSIGLIHLSFAAARSRSGKIIHFVLEGSRKQTEDRLDSRFMEENYYKVRRNELDIYKERALLDEYKILEDMLTIEGMTDKWDYSVEDIEAKMLELEAGGFVADLIVIDYGDLLRPRKTQDNKYAEQESVFRDLKTLAIKAYNGRGVAIWTASQLQRPPAALKFKADTQETFVWTASSLADSYAKIRIVDIGLSLNQTIDENAKGTMRVHISHARDIPGNATFKVQSDFTRMIFSTGKVDFKKADNKIIPEPEPGPQ